MYADNLLSVTQNFLTPDIVNRFSSAIGETTEKTQKGLKAVIPSLLMGIVNKGQTADGAENLTKLVNKDGYEGESVSNLQDNNYVAMGEDAVKNIFGGNVNQVATNLGQSTGINSSGILKMMSMAAPLVMGLLGKKMKREGLNASGLMGFLNQEKPTLTKLVPDGIVGRVGGTVTGAAAGVGAAIKTGAEPPRFHDVSEHPGHDVAGRSPWVIIGLIALGILAFVWWFTGSRNTADVETGPASIVSSSKTVVPPSMGLTTQRAGVSTIESYLESGSTELPKVFRFENLNFTSGSASLISGAETELDQIASALEKYPNVTARIEGHTDNTGIEDQNVILSTERAKSVEEQLMARGIDESRLQVTGFGSANPISTNNSEEGRALNRRIEFVILSK